MYYAIELVSYMHLYTLELYYVCKSPIEALVLRLSIFTSTWKLYSLDSENGSSRSTTGTQILFSLFLNLPENESSNKRRLWFLSLLDLLRLSSYIKIVSRLLHKSRAVLMFSNTWSATFIQYDKLHISECYHKYAVSLSH